MSINMTSTQYANNNGQMCPVCRRESVERGEGATYANCFIFVNCSCRECGANWTDEYVLVRYSNLELK